jgi:AcrR family transcriptional regulator
MTHSRLPVESRKTEILAAALTLAEKHGYTSLTRDQVARRANVVGPTVTHHFGDMGGFRKALMGFAVERQNTVVVAQGLALRDPIARKAPVALRKKALATLSA